MSNYYFIKSKLNGNVIDIKGASTAAGALLDAYPEKSGADNQLWEFVPDPAGSGYYFIKSKLNGNVIDIQGGNTVAGLADGTPLDAFTQKTSGTENQLWQFVKDPAGSGYFFIMSQLEGDVIDIKGASTSAGAALDSFPMKSSGTDNQLWQVVGGSFPATVSTVAASNLGSNTNYLLYGDCKPLIELSVSIEITQDMVCQSVAPPTECKPGGTNQFGFSFQLNCYSAAGDKCAYQQYVMAFWRNSAGGFNVIYGVDNWPVSGPNLINNNFPVLGTLPTAVLPAGYQIEIVLVNSNTAPNSVEFAVFRLLDNHGNQVGTDESVTIASVPGASASDLAPITAFELNIVGPINGEIAVLTSGAGYISYVSLKPPLKVYVPTTSNPFPSCTETTAGTCETANTFYGFLPSNSNLTFKQSFEVSTTKAKIVRPGIRRPSTRYFEK
jgi:hypothetical protein